MIKCILMLIACIYSQPICDNNYAESSNPLITCDIVQKLCAIGNLSNLIANASSNSSVYSLCISYPAYSIVISGNSDTINQSLYIQSTSLVFASGNLSVLNSDDISPVLLNITESVTIEDYNLTANYLTINTLITIINQVQIGGSGTFLIPNNPGNTSFAINNTQLSYVNLSISVQNISFNSTTAKSQNLYLLAEMIAIIKMSYLYSELNRCNMNCSCQINDQGCSQQPSTLQFPTAWLPPSNNSLQPNFDLNNIIALAPDSFFDMFSFVIITPLLTIAASTIESSQIAIYTQNLTIKNTSKIKADGLGCSGNFGFGCGYFNVDLNQLLACTGTGGSHGGFGGNSNPASCTLLVSRPVYDNASYPTYAGSGGGVALQTNHSLGGGVIFLQVYYLNLTSSTISSSGSSSMLGGGGGAGGSINIETALIAGNGTISVDGGNANSSGGGGRISLQFAYWADIQNVTQNYNMSSNITLSAAPGQDCLGLSCGSNGSIYSSICIPGYQLSNQYLCVPCSVGSFKAFYGYTNCVPCNNKPANSIYNSNMGSVALYECTFSCLQGFVLASKSGECISQAKYILSLFGGENVLLSILMIVGTIIGYGIIIFGSKMFNQKGTKKTAVETPGSLKQFSQKPLFQIQQIPFHEFRIYLGGTNQVTDPWRVNIEVFSDLNHKFLNSALFEKCAKQINQTGRYRPYQTTILYLLKITYYPLYYYFKEKFKEWKCRELSKLVKKFRKEIPDWEQITIKLNVKPNNTVACLEIFDYQRSIYDFFLQNYFPLAFVLEKKPLGGYMLDFNDPFLKALSGERDSKMKAEAEDNYIPFLKYLQQLNELLINIPVDLDPVFSHLAAADRYSLQMYLFQPPDNLLNLHPKERYLSNKQLILIIVEEENTTCKHFFCSSQLPNFRYQQMDRLKWELERKTYHKEESSLIKLKWQIKNKIKKPYLVWCLLLLTILVIINQVVIFDNLIVTQTSQRGTQFQILMISYFVLLPMVQFLDSIMSIYWAIKPLFKIGVYCVLLSFANLIKSLILMILAIVNLTRGDSDSYLDFFLLSNVLLVLGQLQIQRLFLWCCRNE